MPARAVGVLASRFDFRFAIRSAQCSGSTPSGQGHAAALRVLAGVTSRVGAGVGLLEGSGEEEGEGVGEGSAVTSRVVTLSNVMSRDIA